MKTIIFMTLIALLGTGCAMVSVKTKTWSMSAASVFKQVEVPKVQIGADGSVLVEGYKGAVAGEAIGTAAGAAVKALAK